MERHHDTNGRIRRLLRTATVALVLSPSPCAADEEVPATNVELPPIVVDADRTEEPALVERSFETPDDVSGFGETIFAEPTWRSFETTAELLGESVGAQIRRQGGRDDFSSLSIRGAPAAQLRILLDGVALGRASDSVVNLSDLPSDLVERIEIYRGFSPVSLTPVSSAGVVNVITRDPERATATAAIGGGSFGSAKMNAGGAGPLLGGAASAFGSYRHTNGDFDFVDENSEHNPDDDDVRKMTNNDSDAIESLVRWRRNVSDSTKLQLRNHVFYKDEGVPDTRNDSAPKTRLETVRETAAAGIGGASGRWHADQIVTWQQKQLRDTTAQDNSDNASETTASTTQARWTRPLGKSHWLSGSSDYTFENFDQRFESGEEGAQADRHSIAAALGDDWTIEPLRTTVSVQVRHQHLWNDSSDPAAQEGTDQSTDPRVGLKWEPLGGLAVKANASTYFRPPTFDELYGTDGFTLGNPTLVPETGVAWDAGLEWSAEHAPFGTFSAGYAWFGSNIEDIIVVQLNFDREARAQNVAEAEIRGHELRLDWKGPAGLALSANYTHQDAIDRTEKLYGLELPGVAPDEGWARVSWAFGRYVVAYDIAVTGSHFIDSEHQKDPLPTRTIHGVSLVYGPFWKGLRLTVEGNNLSDSLVPDVIGYPLPGRSFYATLSWSLPGGGTDAKAM
jgi:outer membrane cobalamin receptor